MNFIDSNCPQDNLANVQNVLSFLNRSILRVSVNEDPLSLGEKDWLGLYHILEACQDTIDASLENLRSKE